jgi:hypothetical protein
MVTPNRSSTPHPPQAQRAIERGLAAHGRQQRVGPLLLDDGRQDVRGDRLDIGGVGDVRIGHDGGRIGIDEDDPVALLAERLAGLGARIVELAGLADDDRSRADDQDRGYVGSFRHRAHRARRTCPGTKKGVVPKRRLDRPAPAAGKPSRRAEPYPITQGDGRDVGKTGTTAPRTGQARNTRETERRRAFVRGRLEARLGFEPSSETVQGLCVAAPPPGRRQCCTRERSDKASEFGKMASLLTARMPINSLHLVKGFLANSLLTQLAQSVGSGPGKSMG